MSLYNFVRQFRTSTSEGYEIMERDLRIGRVDLHFAAEKVYATIVLETDLDEAAVGRIIEEIDDTLVTSATVKREDLNVWVYEGREVGFYSDEDTFGDEFDDVEDEEDLDEDEELEQDEDELDEDDDEEDLT